MAVQIFLSIMALYSCHIIVKSADMLRENPLESLACKTYNENMLDCSHRNLMYIPILDKSWTTELDLSYNQLTTIQGSPFRNLSVLTNLNLSNNEISELDPAAFKGLASLLKLDLTDNNIEILPSGIFNDLQNLRVLKSMNNILVHIPRRGFTHLHSLEEFNINYFGLDTIDSLLWNFNGMTGLEVFGVGTSQANVSHATFKPLHGVKNLLWFCVQVMECFIGDTSFEPFSNLTRLETTFDILPALGSLHSPLQTLVLGSPQESHSYSVDNTTFQGLANVNKSLTWLCLNILLSKIENDAFIWLPNLFNLKVKARQLKTLEEHAFRGLDSLGVLDLSDNALTAIPSVTFSPLTSLKHLYLRSNMISTIEENAFTSVSSLTHLDMSSNKFSEFTGFIKTKWLNSLQSLEFLNIGFDSATPKEVRLSLHDPLFSIHTFELRYLIFNSINGSLCSAFPRVTDLTLSDVNIFNFPESLALHECYVLLSLDLSGSLKASPQYSPNSNHSNINIPSLKTIILAQNELESIGEILFIKAPNLTSLGLSNNNIRAIDISIESAFRKLSYFYIDGNGLKSLSGLERLIFLRHLDAARNQLTEVPLWLLSSSGRPVLDTIDLSNNPFICNCEMEGFTKNEFRKWILSDTDTWLKPGQYVCTTPDRFQGMSVSQVELDCRSHTAFYVGISIPFIILFLMMVIILIKYRWHIQYRFFLLYRNYRPFPDVDEEFEMLQLQYNAYVAYNEESDDDDWVMESLQPNMEEIPEPGNRVKLCIKSRDFIPGSSLIESISENIQLSHKTILVLSPNFMSSEWCYHEMEMAQMRLLEEHLDVLVLVLLRDIPNAKITLSLRKILCKKELIKWPKDRAGQRLFWRRLREELKAPAQVDRRYHM